MYFTLLFSLSCINDGYDFIGCYVLPCRFNQVMGTRGENILAKHTAHPLSQYQTDLLIKGI